MSRDHGLAVTLAVCSLQFTFEPQEGLPAVSDLRQGFLPQKNSPPYFFETVEPWLLVSSGLPCNLTIPICIVVLYYILAK